MRALVLIVALTVAPEAWAENSEVEVAVWALDQFLSQDEYSLTVTNFDGKDLSDRFKDGRAKLPVGHYKLKVNAEGFRSYARDFGAQKGGTQVLALLELGSITTYGPKSPPTRIVGRVANSPIPTDQLWMRVVSAHEGYKRRTAEDARVGADGAFAFHLSNFGGDYWVMVLAFDGNRDTSPYSHTSILRAVWVSPVAHRDTNLEIDLRGR